MDSTHTWRYISRTHRCPWLRYSWVFGTSHWLSMHCIPLGRIARDYLTRTSCGSLGGALQITDRLCDRTKGHSPSANSSKHAESRDSRDLRIPTCWKDQPKRWENQRKSVKKREKNAWITSKSYLIELWEKELWLMIGSESPEDSKSPNWSFFFCDRHSLEWAYDNFLEILREVPSKK